MQYLNEVEIENESLSPRRNKIDMQTSGLDMQSSTPHRMAMAEEKLLKEENPVERLRLK